MKLTLHLADPEETLVVDMDARDRRAFERAGYKGIGMTSNTQDGVKARPENWLSWVSWHALHRQNLTDQSYDEFEARLVETERDDDDADDGAGLGDPTGPATWAG